MYNYILFAMFIATGNIKTVRFRIVGGTILNSFCFHACMVDWKTKRAPAIAEAL